MLHIDIGKVRKFILQADDGPCAWLPDGRHILTAAGEVLDPESGNTLPASGLVFRTAEAGR